MHDFNIYSTLWPIYMGMCHWMGMAFGLRILGRVYNFMSVLNNNNNGVTVTGT